MLHSPNQEHEDKQITDSTINVKSYLFSSIIEKTINVKTITTLNYISNEMAKELKHILINVDLFLFLRVCVLLWLVDSYPLKMKYAP